MFCMIGGLPMLRNLVPISRREHSLRAFESSLLRRIFGRKERKKDGSLKKTVQCGVS
jgi:hypothetical protein